MEGAALGGDDNIEAEFTWVAFFCCLTAASGGALFGYDNGVMGGVTSMDGFLDDYFPSVAANQAAVNTVGNLYCQYDSQTLQLMTSVLFIAGACCELSGTTAYLSRYHGRKRVMMYSGIAFMIAAVLLCASQHVAMIVVGRVLQGIAISFASVSVPIYNSEMAPPKLRGRFNQLYQLVLTFFILVAQVINLIINVTKAVRWGWRFSLGFAFVPSFLLFMGGLFLPDSPNSLLERGHYEQARKNLAYVRGRKDVDREFNNLVEAAKLAAECKHPWKTLFSKKYRPQLILSACSTTFQQWTGINILIFYAPQIFLSIGTTKTISLVAAIILGACNHLSTYVSFWTADKFGRRALFLQAGVQMAIGLIVIALSLKFIPSGSGVWLAWYILAMTCVYDMAYAWSYGPLAWLYPSEIQPLETRSAGLAVASFSNLLFSFVIAQTFLTMLCALQLYLWMGMMMLPTMNPQGSINLHLREARSHKRNMRPAEAHKVHLGTLLFSVCMWATFLFFAVCVIVMTIFVGFFFVETKHVPLEECPFIFKKHWFWKRYANIGGLGFQEKLVLKKKIEEAQEKGEAPPDMPGMDKMLDEMKHPEKYHSEGQAMKSAK